jgi:hypothetical protein
MCVFARFLLAAVLLAVTLSSRLAFASNERFSVTQAPDRSVLVTLNGNLHYCSFVIVGPPKTNVAGSSISITSNIALPGCPAPPPDFVPPPPTPYSYTVNLGVLVDDTYAITWAFNPPLVQQFQTSFLIEGGLLPGPRAVPALSPFTYTILLLLVICSYRILRKRSFRHPISTHQKHESGDS